MKLKMLFAPAIVNARPRGEDDRRHIELRLARYGDVLDPNAADDQRCESDRQNQDEQPLPRVQRIDDDARDGWPDGGRDRGDRALYVGKRFSPH